MDQTWKLQLLWEEIQHECGGRRIQLNTLHISLIFFFFLVLLKLLFGPKKPKNFPPSPPKLPIIGNLHQLGKLPHRSLSALSEKYGPLMLLRLGHTQTLVISSAKLAEQAMKTHDIIFSNRPQTTAAKILLYECHDVGFAPYGEYWRQAKKICTLELFSTKRVESFQHVREEEVGLLVTRVRKACVENFVSVDVSQLLSSASNNIVSRCVLGEKFEDENGKSRFAEFGRKFILLMTDFCVGDFFPVFGWIDVLTGFVGELKRYSKILDEFLDRVIEEHKARRFIIDGDLNDTKDFVDIMLQLQRDDKLDYHFTQDNLKAIILDMFVGGSDTTAAAVEWTMAELIRNPSTMKKVQEEIRRVIGKKKKIEPNDIRKMEYMNCVIKESMRLHPPVPLLVPRETSEIVSIEGYQIPSKASVFVNAWAIQRDPKIWERPNDFIPERFMQKNLVDFKGQNYELIPFGSGRRKCPGMSFGLASLEYALVNLLYWFDWKLPDDMAGDLDMSEEYGISVRKKIPLYLKPIPYSIPLS